MGQCETGPRRGVKKLLPIMSEETIIENDIVKRVRKTPFTLVETIHFKNEGKEPFEKGERDWYITVALEKADKVKVDRHLLTQELLLQYRWAIREGFNHMLDPNLRNQYDYPRNQNTINGIKGYIKKIQEKSDKEMEDLEKPWNHETIITTYCPGYSGNS